MADDCQPILSEKRSAQLFKEVLIPAVTADLHHEHILARNILRRECPNDVIELLFGVYITTISQVNADKGFDVVETLRQTALRAQSGEFDE